jgi:hypothetical protein
MTKVQGVPGLQTELVAKARALQALEMRVEGKMSYPQIAQQLDYGGEDGARTAVERLHRAAWAWQEQGGPLDERDPHHYSMRGLGGAARNQVELLDRLDSQLGAIDQTGRSPEVISAIGYLRSYLRDQLLAILVR